MFVHADQTKLDHFGLVAPTLHLQSRLIRCISIHLYSVLTMETNRIDSSPELAIAVDALHDDPQQPMISPRSRTMDMKVHGILNVGQARVT